MRDLVIGASGQVGGALLDFLNKSHLNKNGGNAVGTYYLHNPPHFPLRPLDITSGGAVQSLLEELCPRHVYLPSSYTNVDGCEEDQERSYLVNVIGVKNVVAACRRIGSKLIYFSSDYVFDGKAGPYLETSPPSPISVYGRHKVEAEELVSSLSGSLILRTTVVYGREWQGKNFVVRLLKTLLDGKTMSVPDDQVGNPTFAPSLAEVAARLAERSDCSGVFNAVGKDRVSRYEFAREAAYVFGLDTELVLPVSTESLKQKALRPLSGGLVMDKVEQLFPGILVGYREGLKILHRQLT